MEAQLRSAGFYGLRGRVLPLLSPEACLWVLTTCPENSHHHPQSCGLHAYVQKNGLESHRSIGGFLVSLFAQRGKLLHAQHVFDGLVERNQDSWDALISGYVRFGDLDHALSLYRSMQQYDSLCPGSHTFVALLRACTMTKNFDRGFDMCAEIARTYSFHADLFIGAAVIDMFSKCGNLVLAREIFDKLHVRNVVSWNVLLIGYVESGRAEEALDHYEESHIEGVLPNAVTFVCILKACSIIGDFSRGQEIHAYIELLGLSQCNIFVASALIDMYARNGLLTEGSLVFENLAVRDVVSWTSLISGYVDHGHGDEALRRFEEMKEQGIYANSLTLVSCLKACASIGDAIKGQKIHSEIEQKGFSEKNLPITSTLIDMYSKCGSINEMLQLFQKLPVRDVVSWTSLIHGLVENGQIEKAFEYCEILQAEDTFKDANAFISMLRVYGTIGSIGKIMCIHLEVEKRGWLHNDLSLSNALMDAYGRSGSPAKAQEIFDKLHVKNVASWNTLIGGHAEHGDSEKVLRCLDKMLSEDISPDVVTFVCILKACSSICAIDTSQEIHAEIERKGLLGANISVGNSLIDMYAKCSFVGKAREVFDKLPVQDVISWNALMGGYIARGHDRCVLNCFKQMQMEGVCPNTVTLVNVLGACGAIGVLEKGQEIHATVEATMSLGGNLSVGASLVDIYARCSSMEKAQAVFDWFPSHDVAFWNVLISGYAEHELGEEALMCFKQMQSEGFFPDNLTFIACLKACSSTRNIDKGREIYADMERRGLQEQHVAHSLIGLYSECGLLLEAQQVFDKLHFHDVNLWNALIAGYVEAGYSVEAMMCFEEMQLEGVTPNSITMVFTLKACRNSRETRKGCEIHSDIERKGLQKSNLFIASSLVDMYSKLGLLDRSRQLFDKLISRDAALWNSLITGYAESGDGEEALACFERMHVECIPPNAITYICTLKVCGALGAVNLGHEIHAEIERRGLLDRDVVGNSLVDMYAKCGLVTEARKLLQGLPHQDVVSWNSLIAGYGQLGELDHAFHTFYKMRSRGAVPDAITFVLLLAACCHIGSVNKCELYFERMGKDYGIVPMSEHQNCLIDVLGRTGRLERAISLMQRMPGRPDLVVWRSVLGACRKWGQVELGKTIFEQGLVNVYISK